MIVIELEKKILNRNKSRIKTVTPKILLYT